MENAHLKDVDAGGDFNIVVETQGGIVPCVFDLGRASSEGVHGEQPAVELVGYTECRPAEFFAFFGRPRIREEHVATKAALGSRAGVKVSTKASLHAAMGGRVEVRISGRVTKSYTRVTGVFS